MKKKCDRGTKQDPAAQWSACRPAGHHTDCPGSLSVHHPGGFQANAHKTYYLLKIFSKTSLISASFIVEASGKNSSTILPISIRRFV